MTIRKLLAGAVTAGSLLVAIGGVAAAHVTVDPPDAPQGAVVALAFRVRSESATAATTKVQLQLPTDHVLPSVKVRPLAGWAHAVTTKHLATPVRTDDGPVSDVVAEVDWTATGEGIRAGEYEDFELEVGPLPTDATSLVFKVVQTYADGSEAAWIDPPVPGGAEPEHPAPVLTLSASPNAEPSSTATTGSTVATASGAATVVPLSPPSADTNDEGFRGLAVAALGVAIAGVALGALALAVSSRRSRGSA